RYFPHPSVDPQGILPLSSVRNIPKTGGRWRSALPRLLLPPIHRTRCESRMSPCTNYFGLLVCMFSAESDYPGEHSRRFQHTVALPLAIRPHSLALPPFVSQRIP